MPVSQQIRAKSELRRGHGPLCNLSDLHEVSSLPMPPQTIWQSEHCSRGEGQSQQHSYYMDPVVSTNIHIGCEEHDLPASDIILISERLTT